MALDVGTDPATEEGGRVMWSADAEIMAVSEAVIVECPEDPARLRGMPIGMYHCPQCGCMVIAGLDGHPHEECCFLGLWEPW